MQMILVHVKTKIDEKQSIASTKSKRCNSEGSTIKIGTGRIALGSKCASNN